MVKTILITETTKIQRRKFDCGTDELTNFFQRFALSNHTKNLGNTNVLVINEDVVGYYTVSMSNCVEFENEDFPRYPIPVALIGRLAVSKDEQGKGWGKWLLGDALCKICIASQYVGVYAAIVEAKDEKAKSFYEQYGFMAFSNEPLTLYLPLNSMMSEIKNPVEINK